MNKIVCALAMSLQLFLAGCGGENSVKTPAEEAITYELYAQDVNSAEDAIRLYASRMNLIADLIENIQNNNDADKAAKVINDSAAEYKLLDKRLDEKGRADLARDFSSGSSGYADMHTRKYLEAQTRLSLAMQNVAKENPRAMIKLAKAVAKLPDIEKY